MTQPLPGPIPSKRTVGILKVLAWLVVVGVLAWLIWAVLGLATENGKTEGRLDGAQRERAALRTANAQQDAALAEANKRLKEAGQAPVPVPTQPTVVAGPRGDQGPIGLQGPQGPPGEDGASATDAQVLQSVNAFCSTRGDCQGPQGLQGLPGKDGKDGATGPKGDTGDTGPAGPPGEQGPAGEDGSDGTAGKDAFPFTFTFAMPDTGPLSGQAWTCTVTDPAIPAQCQPVDSQPISTGQ